ncbi:hypothetical protein ACQKP8_25675 [Photobacterium alginatilyticum]
MAEPTLQADASEVDVTMALDGGLYKMFWQQGFDRSMAFDGVTGH